MGEGARKTGRPPLDRTDPSTTVYLRLPSRKYDALYRRASQARVSVPELIRQQLFRPHDDDDPDDD